MFNRNAIKLVTGIVTGLAVGSTTGEIIKNNTDVETTQDKIQVGIASFALGGMAGTMAVNYTDQYVDFVADMVGGIRENRQVAKNAKKAEKAAAAQAANQN